MAGSETPPTPTEELPNPDADHEAGPHQHAASSEIHFGPRLGLPVDDVIILDGRDLRREARLGEGGRQATIDQRAAEVRETILQDAEARGFEDGQGLSITLGNGHRYVVRDVSMQQERRSETHRVGLPKLHGVEHRLETFGREEETRRVRKTWGLRSTVPIPFLGNPNLDGSKVAIQRRETSLDPKFEDTPAIVVEEFDQNGDLITLESRKGAETRILNDIYQLAGEHGVEEADWQERRDPTGEKQIIPVTLPGYASRPRQSREEDAPSIAEVITAQLEGRGIYNWEGLFWRRRTPGRPGQREGSYMTQEVISDSSHKYVDDKGYVWGRKFIVRTTHATDNGIAVHDKEMEDSEFFHYLETGNIDLTMSEMRLIRDKPDGQAAELEPHHPEGQNRSEWAASPDHPEPISLDEALELMSYREIYEKTDGVRGEDEADDRIKARIKRLKESGDDVEIGLAKELQAASSEVGMDRLAEVIKDMHATYTEELRRLGLKQSHWDYYSPSLIIRDLMKKRRENRLTNPADDADDSWDPLSDGFEARQFRNGLIDLYVGRRFGKHFTKLSKSMPVPTGKVDSRTNQPEHQERREFEPNEGMFKSPSVVDGARLTAKRKRDKIWGTIEEQAAHVFRLRTAVPRDSRGGNPHEQKNPHVKNGELERAERILGRLLRRTIPPRAWYRQVDFS